MTVHVGNNTGGSLLDNMPTRKSTRTRSRASLRRVTTPARRRDSVQQSSGRKAVPGLAKRLFLMRAKMRVFLAYYEKCLSIEAAADRAGVSERLPYMWRRKPSRVGRWFKARLEGAEQKAIGRTRAQAFDFALVQRSETAVFAILKARDPMFMPKPKELTPRTQVNLQQNNYADAQYSAGTLTDAELAEMDRLLKKMGVPEQLLHPASALLPADVVEGETVKP